MAAGVNMSFNGFNEYIEKLQNMGHDIDDVVEKQLEGIGERVTNDLRIGIAKHKQTGKTEKQLREPIVKNVQGSKYFVKTGFVLPEGLPARYIDRGTPTNKKDPFITRALNKSKIKADQQKVFQEITRYKS